MTPFAKKYALKFEKAVDCLIKDRGRLRMFFGFPADHWNHLRTTNPIECMFATARQRAIRVKGEVSQDTARLMVFKLAMAVEVLTAPMGPLPCRRVSDTISPCASLDQGMRNTSRSINLNQRSGSGRRNSR